MLFTSLLLNTTTTNETEA